MELFSWQQLEYILRILVAGICGGLIGLERRNRAKEAGIRTHCVVACAAALMMVISKYAFFDVIKEGIYSGVEVRLDPSRVASTIASGIGFLGAGMIFVHKNTITGLTTAAGIWATSGVGMAIGSGMYVVGMAATAIIISVQILFHIHFRWSKSLKSKNISIKNVSESGYQQIAINMFKEMGIRVNEVSAEKNVETMTKNYKFVVDVPEAVSEEEIIEKIEYDCKVSN